MPTTMTPIDRQQDYMRMLRTPFIKLCRLRFLNPNGTTAFALDNNPRNRRSKAFIAEGNVTANLQNGQRMSATVTLANADENFSFMFSKIWFGQQIALDEGLVLSNGEEYYRQTGIFIIDNPQETINPNTKTVTYNLLDKWADLDGTLDGNLEGTYVVSVGTNIYSPIVELLQENRGNGTPVDIIHPVFTEYYNDMTQELPDGTDISMVLSPYTLTVDGDGGTVGEVILGLGGMVNAWVGYDNTGRLRLEPSQDDISDAQKAVLYRFSPDETVLLGLAYTIKKEELFNDYIVVGEQLDDYTQPGGRARNYDPLSTTSVQVIGRKTKRESASGYATTQQCMDLAEWRLKRSGVLQKAVNISCSQMFHIELNSLVEIVRTDKPGNPIERHLIQGYSRPLANNGPMQITAVSVNDFVNATVTKWPEPKAVRITTKVAAGNNTAAITIETGTFDGVMFTPTGSEDYTWTSTMPESINGIVSVAHTSVPSPEPLQPFRYIWRVDATADVTFNGTDYIAGSTVTSWERTVSKSGASAVLVIEA